jgi:hypothetical protein
VVTPRPLRLLRLATATPYLLALGCGRVETSIGAEFARDAAAAGSDGQAPVSVCFEAESGKLSGFTIEMDPAASGGEYVLPPPGSQSLLVPGDASAAYTFELATPATYVLWGRIHGPGALNNAFWVTVDNGPSYRWQLSTGVVWFWGPVTSGTDYGNPLHYVLDAGSHELVFRNSTPGVGLDRVCVTVPGDMPLGNDTPCDPPNSIQLADGGCVPSCGSHGSTTCGAACAGQPALSSYDCAVCCFVPDAGADGGPPDSTTD